MTSLVWLRDDLRLDDQPAIRAAASGPALYVYVFDPASLTRPLGGASRWWLDKSLAALSRSFETLGARLDIVAGPVESVIPALAQNVQAVYWTRRYGAKEIETDKRIKAALNGKVQSFNGQLLREPWDVKNAQDAPFKVFTPYWRASRALGPFAAPLPEPAKLVAAPWPENAPARVVLHPQKPNWSQGLAEAWTPGETGAQARLVSFLDSALEGYSEGRNRLDQDSTSRLSPHLRFGEISPRRIVAASEGRNADKFLSEIGWREFSYHLLYQAPNLATQEWSPRFKAFPWRRDENLIELWQKGRTGYPVVDAAMRELWTTGYMHNRARMIVASFLTKHLLQDWRAGEAWFWETLCDADPANNPASWQWTAGCGADAAPYFRVFNPALQAEKFDPDGAYVRRWGPRDHIAPIVDHAEARARALAAFAGLSA